MILPIQIQRTSDIIAVIDPILLKDTTGEPLRLSLVKSAILEAGTPSGQTTVVLVLKDPQTKQLYYTEFLADVLHAIDLTRISEEEKWKFIQRETPKSEHEDVHNDDGKF